MFIYNVRIIQKMANYYILSNFRGKFMLSLMLFCIFNLPFQEKNVSNYKE